MSFSAAGILPYFMSRSQGTVYLLSQERYGDDKGTYSDFGGSIEPGETPIQAALNELAEESRGTIVAPQLQYVSSHRGYVLFSSQVPYRDYNSIFQSTKIPGFKYNEKTRIVEVRAHQLNRLVSGHLTIYTTNGEEIMVRPITRRCIINGIQNGRLDTRSI